MTALTASYDELENWLKNVAEQEKITNYELQTYGNSEKGDGYLGDIVFLSLSGTSENAEPKTYHLVVKHGKKSALLRQSTKIREVFLNEILVYEQVFPAFQRFQRERNVKHVFDAFPKCYASLVESSMEVLILDNMKRKCYELHDRFDTMDSRYVNLVLRQYGKFHGISLAMKHQENDRFLKLTDNIKNAFREYDDVSAMYEGIKKSLSNASVLLRNNNYGTISDKVDTIIDSVYDIMTTLENRDDPYSVLVHGDCWNNNFMFSYEDDDKQNPEKVCILDWQVSRLASPVLDLAYFLFLNCSTDLLANIDDLLHIYYDSLSECVRELGSDPEEVFPFSKLVEHWEKYSVYGVLLAPFILKICLSNKDEAPDMVKNLENGGTVVDSFMIELQNPELYKKRLLSLMINPTFVKAINHRILSEIDVRTYKMTARSATTTELEVWIKQVLENEELTDYTIEVHGNADNGDGYMGDVVFLTLTGTFGKSGTKVYDLVLKHGKKSEKMRKSTRVREIFLGEISMYNIVFPAFQQFQRERNATEVFDVIPKCYGTVVESAMEVLVLDNIKKRGYELHNKLVTMDLQHVKLILEQYGRFHGISLAMKDQDKEQYTRLTDIMKNPFRDHQDDNAGESMKSVLVKASDILEKNNNGHVSKKLDAIVDLVPELMRKLADDLDDPYAVIVHGDCWNNNFMFSYKDDKQKTPKEVCILDWQLSRSGSPAIDLSYFLYICCSPAELTDIEKLLHIYHESLSECVRELGSDPDKLLPFAELMAHWKKYSVYGVVMAPLLLNLTLACKEEAPDFAGEFDNGNDFSNLIMFEVGNQELYKARLLQLMTNPTFINSITSECLS